MEVREYQTVSGRSPFASWFDSLDAVTAARVRTAIVRVQSGNLSQAKAVGSGVSELKLDFGPGYRVYFGKDGTELVILLAGGTKKRQQKDIADAIASWRDYKARKQV